MRNVIASLCLAIVLGGAVQAEWPAPVSPVIPAADGYVSIPNAAIPPDRAATYREIFDATQAATDPSRILPALNMAGSELNAFAVAGVPREHARFVFVFHGPAMAGLLDDAHYRARFGVPNPNLPVLTALRKAGAELYVCGQNVAADKIDPTTLSPDVKIASDALIVIMTYQAKGYGTLFF